MESGDNVIIRKISRNTALVTPVNWTAIKDLIDEAHMVIQLTYSLTQERTSIFKKQGKKNLMDFERTVEKPKSKSLKEKWSMRSSSAMKPNPEKSACYQPQTRCEVADLIRSAFGPKYWKEIKDIKHLFKDTVFLKMEDTGGQPEFMDMLPALTIGPALYLLMCKLTDELNSKYTVSYRSPTGETTTPEKSIYTVEEVLLTALASISCFKSYASTPQFNSEIKSSHAINKKLLTSSCKSSLAYIRHS